MIKYFNCFLLFFVVLSPIFGQANANGKLDQIDEFATKFEVPFTMPDGTHLMTDIYVPVVQDCLLVKINGEINLFGLSFDLADDIELLKKGTQIVIYDTLNGQPITGNHRYKLPIVMMRTPYNKKDEGVGGPIFSLLGYAHAVQDTRGRYASEGVFLPLYSDSWNKNAYHNSFGHQLDVTSLSDPKNANRHEDGYWSLKYITDSLIVPDSLNLPTSGSLLCNGNIGLFGVSATGNAALQAAAAHRINPEAPGLKCIYTMISSLENHYSLGFSNGTFREKTISEWLRSQLVDLDNPEDLLPLIDNNVQNALHTPFDFNLTTEEEVIEAAIDHFSTKRYNGEYCGYYPNSPIRKDIDASQAMVNPQGESIASDGTTPLSNLTKSRYTNMEVPTYHLAGWWDIYPEGQIQTFLHSREYLSNTYGNRDLQKIIIGPWAHQTVGTRTTGDMKFPPEVVKFNKVSFDAVDLDNLALNEIVEAEILTWLRFNLNRNSSNFIGEPKFLIPRSNSFQNLTGSILKIRIPADDYILTFPEIFNYLNGTGTLNNIRAEFKFLWQTVTINLPTSLLPPTGDPIFEGLEGQTMEKIFVPDYKNDIPAVRFWVCGNDSLDQVNSGNVCGNYWFSSETFPPENTTQPVKLFLHSNHSLNVFAPGYNEGGLSYVHDPNNPVLTVGGGNMAHKTPDSSRVSQGPMNLADSSVIDLTMNRPDVLQFETEVLEDSMCIVGFPTATIQASSIPEGVPNGLTNTEFYVRILDVYPDGREFFVVEGGVNARARDYARSIVGEYTNNEIPFSNIEIGEVYEYKFKLMPIAYTFGKNHKIKVLLSSSNYPRYQSCPNLPIEEGDFFRRKPNDGQGYVFNGELMYPRLTTQQIEFSNEYGQNSTHIEFPVYGSTLVSAPKSNNEITNLIDASIFPNPTKEEATIFMNYSSTFTLELHNMFGTIVYSKVFTDSSTKLSLEELPSGTYFIKLKDLNSPNILKKKLIVQ